MEPLFDLHGRILAHGTGATTSAIVDGLLRLHASPHRTQPITFYIIGGVDRSTPLSAGDALLLADVMRTVTSPIRTVGMGWLTGWQPVLLACGTRGQRHLLCRSLVALGPLEWNSLAMPKNPIGLHSAAPVYSPRAVEEQLLRELHTLMTGLNLPPDLFKTGRLLNAREAIENRLADRVVERQLLPELPPLNPSAPKIHEAQP